MTRLVLTKAHGLGNDFLLLLDGSGAIAFDDRVARLVCDRTRGVGADGLIRITGAAGDYRMELRNADGGPAEVSGNGLRCVALHLHRRGLVGDRFVLGTSAGPRQVVVEADSVTADMGVPGTMAAPVGPAATGLDIETVTLGNPHVVVFVTDPATADVPGIGAAIEHDASYPARTNVEFVAVEGPGRVRARIWERGVGETMASGTGGSASAVAVRRRGLVGPDIAVEMPGGELRIRWDGGADSVMMTGPARILFDVEVDLDVLG